MGDPARSGDGLVGCDLSSLLECSSSDGGHGDSVELLDDEGGSGCKAGDGRACSDGGDRFDRGGGSVDVMWEASPKRFRPG